MKVVNAWSWLVRAQLVQFVNQVCENIRKYGYSVRGRPVHSQKLLVQGECVSAMMFMSVNGFLSCTVDVEVFLEVFAKRLLPHLVLFDSRTHIVCSSWAVVSFTVVTRS